MNIFSLPEAPEVDEAHDSDERNPTPLQPISHSHLHLCAALLLSTTSTHLLPNVQTHLVAILTDFLLGKDSTLLQKTDGLFLGSRQREDVHSWSDDEGSQ